MNVQLEETKNATLVHGTNSGDTGTGAVRQINGVGNMKATARLIQIAFLVWFVVSKTARKDVASLIGLIVVNCTLMFSTQVTIFILR